MPTNPQNIEIARQYAEKFTRTGQPTAQRSRLELIGDAGALAAGVEEMLAVRVNWARLHGHSWQEIAEELGVTRQAAQQRFGRKEA